MYVGQQGLQQMMKQFQGMDAAQMQKMMGKMGMG